MRKSEIGRKLEREGETASLGSGRGRGEKTELEKRQGSPKRRGWGLGVDLFWAAPRSLRCELSARYSLYSLDVDDEYRLATGGIYALRVSYRAREYRRSDLKNLALEIRIGVARRYYCRLLYRLAFGHHRIRRARIAPSSHFRKKFPPLNRDLTRLVREARITNASLV